jgi:N-acetylglucosaminyldiphosphoundecaprenol N-acetyl-beta-D-mannosaminyltransferase
MSNPTTAFVNVLGVRIDVSTLEDATSRIGGWIAARERTYVCVCSVNNVVEARRSLEYRRVLNRSSLNTPDGMPLVWQLHRHGYASATRVYGPDLFVSVCKASAATGWRHFFYGGRDGVAVSLAARMGEQFQGLQIAGVLSPPVASVDELCNEESAAQINSSGADIVWVGLSTPKQEQWMARMRERLEAPVLIGVGAAFDFHTHRIPQAPPWMQARGLEWVFRLMSEPRRLWRRYLIGNSLFLWDLAFQELGLKSFPL